MEMHPIREVVACVVDDVVGADRSDRVHLRRAAYAGHLGAERLGERHREPMINVFCPGWTLPASRRAWSAVQPEMGTAAACSYVRFAGLGARSSSPGHAYSAKEPLHVPNTSSPG